MLGAEEQGETEFVSGFAWPVPKAFVSALSLCRFEEGDTFYNHPSAYEDPWGQTSSLLRFCIQVRFPPVSRAAPREAPDGAEAPDEEEHHPQAAEGLASVNSASASPTGQRRFATNSWRSSAVVDISNLETRDEWKAVATTQGRLYSLLWHGDMSVRPRFRRSSCLSPVIAASSRGAPATGGSNSRGPRIERIRCDCLRIRDGPGVYWASTQGPIGPIRFAEDRTGAVEDF